MIPEIVKKLAAERKICVLGTSSKTWNPNLVYVECLGIHEDKILIADSAFEKTLVNIKENSKVSIVVTDDKDQHIQIKGMAEYFNSGKWLEKVTKMNKDMPYRPKGALLITLTEVYDLHTHQKLL